MMTRVTSPAACLHASNLLTYASLAAGLAAIATAFAGSERGAGALMCVAVLADVFDGRFAKRFERSAALASFGVQIDSLVDAVVFTAAPVVCMAAVGASDRPGFVWWAAAFVYTACGLTRLGFYNIAHEQEVDFIGLPAPVAALIWSTVLLVHPGPIASALVFAASGVAMIAPIRIRRPTGRGLSLFVAWPLIVIAAHLVAYSG